MEKVSIIILIFGSVSEIAEKLFEIIGQSNTKFL